MKNTNFKILALIFLAFALLVFAVGCSNNNDNTEGDLDGEDEFKMVFVTSTTYSGNLGGMKGADAICQMHASGANLPGIFMAWIATDASDEPAVRFNHSQVPYTLVNGEQVASNWDDLIDGELDQIIYLDEHRGDRTTDVVWTNVTSLGEVGSDIDWPENCNLWTRDTVDHNGGGVGRIMDTGHTWTRDTTGDCDWNLRLYCFEQ